MTKAQVAVKEEVERHLAKHSNVSISVALTPKDIKVLSNYFVVEPKFFGYVEFRRKEVT